LIRGAEQPANTMNNVVPHYIYNIFLTPMGRAKIILPIKNDKLAKKAISLKKLCRNNLKEMVAIVNTVNLAECEVDALEDKFDFLEVPCKDFWLFL
jgi:hypothetical protein